MQIITLDAELYKINGWTILRLPKDASAKLPSRSQVMVKGTMNGYEFQAPMEPDGDGSHWLNVDKTMREATGLEPGDTATLEIEATPNKEWPEPEAPKDLQIALDNATPEIQKVWASATAMAHWEWLRWINSTTNPETRKKRIEVSISKLSKGMRRPCCFNRSMCCVPDVSKNGILLEPAQV